MIERALKKEIEEKMFKGKAIIIAGARQVGKTTLAQEIASNYKTIYIDCDNHTERELLERKDFNFLKKTVGNNSLILIDEAQKVQTIGETIKLMVDGFKDKQVIATGSSSINLLDNTQEPLTGRKVVKNIFPLSMKEIYGQDGFLEFFKNMDEHLVYGSYPEVVLKDSYKEKTELLKEISTSYLYKDIFEFQQIKNSRILYDLLKMLALQIGSEVSYNELANNLGLDKKTVESYIDLLEKSYVIFRLHPYTRNKRKEVTKLKKIYFYDLGVRNSIINNFNSLDKRNDAGELFENFCLAERMKLRSYENIFAEQYFWRTHTGKEVDLVEEREGDTYAYEFKITGKGKPSKDWENFKIIGKDELIDFLFTV